jgi:hypothetical protein
VSDLLAWCFHSPRRLLLVAVALVVLIIGVGAAVQALTPSSTSSPDARTTTVATAAVANSGAAVDAAVAFTRAWASKPASVTVEQWRQGVQPLATPELARLLATTDPAALPGGGPAGEPGVRFLSAASALIEVPLSSGPRVLVTVVLLGGRWLAQDVQPLAGDAGAVGGPGAGPSAATAGGASGSAG